MHDPLTVVFEIRRPWPRSDRHHTDQASRTGTRWRISGAFWTIAGRGLYWPCMVTIWHHDPSDYDTTTCSTRGRAWRWHVHHWRIQVSPLQHLRRRLLTRCAWCGGASAKGDHVNISHQWDGPRARWWQGEKGLFHRDCSAIKSAHGTCVCQWPVLDHCGYGLCARCGQRRRFGVTAQTLTRLRDLAAIPPGRRRPAA